MKERSEVINVPEFIVEIEFEVLCARCGNGLCRNTSTREGYRGRLIAEVEPCENCLADARSEGYDEGFENGKEAGADKRG